MMQCLMPAFPSFKHQIRSIGYLPDCAAAFKETIGYASVRVAPSG